MSIALVRIVAHKIVAAKNISWVIAPVTWGMIPGLTDIIWSIKVMAPGLVSEGFLMDPPECFTLVFNGLLWYLPNRQATQGGSFLTLLIFLGIINLLDNLRRYFMEQWFRPWCQTRIYLLSYPKGSLVYHSLTMLSLMRLAPTASFSTFYKLVGSWDGHLFGVRRSSPDFRSSYWPKIWISRCLPRRPLGALLQGVKYRRIWTFLVSYEGY